MKIKEKISLIEGCFEPKDAKEILYNIISNKIQFHQKKNFSSVERYGFADENSVKRIPELKDNLQKLLLIISEAENSKKQLCISSEISIQIK